MIKLQQLNGEPAFTALAGWKHCFKFRINDGVASFFLDLCLLHQFCLFLCNEGLHSDGAPSKYILVLACVPSPNPTWSQGPLGALWSQAPEAHHVLQTDPNDGNWHMVTISTQPRSFAGYRLFLDGSPAGQLTGSSTTANRTGNIQVCNCLGDCECSALLH